jgi:hypothetical protein
MKRCPQCGNTYTDDSLKFCLQDGATLFGLDDRAPATEILPLGDEPSTRARLPRDLQPTVVDSSPARNSKLIVALTVFVVLLALIGGISAWIWRGGGAGQTTNVKDSTPTNQNQRQVASENDNQSIVAPSASSAGFPAASPSPSAAQFGFIKGDMTYPSDAIPDDMVVCAENIDTTEVTCTKQRSGWQSSVSYSLKVPPGRYYVYGVLLKENKGERAYYTDFIPCGMDVKCKSHKRIMLEVKAGQNLAGIKVGDWWANLKS